MADVILFACERAMSAVNRPFTVEAILATSQISQGMTKKEMGESDVSVTLAFEN